MASNNISADDWTLFDKIMYGGLGYGSFCLPTDFFKVILAIVFPPLGEVCNIVENTVSSDFPYLNWESIKTICEYDNLKKIIYSFVLTTLFYIPGLVYTLTNIVEKERRPGYNRKPEFWDEGKSDSEKTLDTLDYAFKDKTSRGLEKGGRETGRGFETAGQNIKGGLEQTGEDIKGGFEIVGGGFESIGNLF